MTPIPLPIYHEFHHRTLYLFVREGYYVISRHLYGKFVPALLSCVWRRRVTSCTVVTYLTSSVSSVLFHGSLLFSAVVFVLSLSPRFLSPYVELSLSGFTLATFFLYPQFRSHLWLFLFFSSVFWLPITLISHYCAMFRHPSLTCPSHHAAPCSLTQLFSNWRAYVTRNIRLMKFMESANAHLKPFRMVFELSVGGMSVEDSGVDATLMEEYDGA